MEADRGEEAETGPGPEGAVKGGGKEIDPSRDPGGQGICHGHVGGGEGLSP